MARRWLLPNRSHPPTTSPQKVIARFPFEKRQTQLFPEVYRPVVTVSLWSPGSRRWRNVQMLVDTGADYTILPKYIATLLGIDLTNAPVMNTQGLNGLQKVYFLEKLRLKIGSAEREVPVGFVPLAKAPSLLGRHACLETFGVFFEYNRRIEFRE
jgi:predicted aspartyl protease